MVLKNKFIMIMLNSCFVQSFVGFGSYIRKSNLVLYSSFLEQLSGRFKPNKQIETPKSESDKLIEFIDYKPWRAPKVKNLKYIYRPWKESWQERYRNETDETIYLYGVSEFRPSWECTRVDELWEWPWLWTKIKAERCTVL
jgi:hypothetical protein